MNEQTQPAAMPESPWAGWFRDIVGDTFSKAATAKFEPGSLGTVPSTQRAPNGKLFNMAQFDFDTSSFGINPLLLVGGIVLVAFLALRKA